MISLFLFIYLFLAALGLCCYMWAFSSCVSRDYSPVAVCEPLIAVASFFAKTYGFFHRTVGPVLPIRREVRKRLDTQASCQVFVLKECFKT